jgi:hypothetical protein
MPGVVAPPFEDWANYCQLERYRLRGDQTFLSNNAEYDLGKVVGWYFPAQTTRELHIHGDVGKVEIDGKHVEIADSTVRDVTVIGKNIATPNFANFLPAIADLIARAELLCAELPAVESAQILEKIVERLRQEAIQQVPSKRHLLASTEDIVEICEKIGPAALDVCDLAQRLTSDYKLL